MSLLIVAVILFLLLEISNVIVLYFKPESKFANSVGNFNAWQKSKEFPEIHRFIQYLVYWVAGTKIIVISLLIIILIFADETTKQIAVTALIISITTFYWKLFPLLRKMDKNKDLSSLGYANKLAIVIAMFIFFLSIGLIAGYFYIGNSLV